MYCLYIINKGGLRGLGCWKVAVRGVPFKKGESGNPLGRGAHNAAIEEFRGLTREQRYQKLRDDWAEISQAVMIRAKQFAKTCSPQEFGKLYQLIMSGAVSLDKAFPPKEQQQPTIQVNMFGSLGQKAKQIVVPQTPMTVTVQPTEPTEVPVHAEADPSTPRLTDGTSHHGDQPEDVRPSVVSGGADPQDTPLET